MTDEPQPPILLCTLIALATVLAGAGVLWFNRDDSGRRLTAELSASPGDLSQLIELQRIYSSPPQQEDPSRYPKLPAGDASQRRPAKNTQ